MVVTSGRTSAPKAAVLPTNKHVLSPVDLGKEGGLALHWNLSLLREVGLACLESKN